MSEQIENGAIESATINIDRGFILTALIHIAFNGSGQGFGGYALGGTSGKVGEHGSQPNLAAEFICGCMRVADVESWGDLKGKVIRVKRDEPFGKIKAIGHPIKDLWFYPESAFAMLKQENDNEIPG